jgi:hypothetical protein
VIKAGGFPAGGGMARVTTNSIFSLVGIVPCVAGITSTWRALKNIIDVATYA